MKEIIKKNSLKWAGVLLIAALMVSSTAAVSEDTMDRLENDGDYVNPSSSWNMDSGSGDSLFLQLPHGPYEHWYMLTSDAGAGYIMYENFWGVTEPIGDIHWWGIVCKFIGGWQPGNPNNLVFDIKFYADDPNRHLRPCELVATFTDVVPPVITGTGYYYNNKEMYYFDGVELDTPINLSEGWVSIYSKSSGYGEDWLLWASAKTGDGFSYQDGYSPPGTRCDQAMELTGVPSKPPEKPETPDGPTEGIVGVEYMFFTSTTDPEGEQVLYWWDWGDGTPGEWTDPSGSGVMVHASHIWNASGDYSVKVKAKDLHDKESEWSDSETIHIVDAAILELGNITGKLFKVDAVIKNSGGIDVTRVDWSITLDGGVILLGKETTGDVLSIVAGDEIKISSGLIFGFGRTVITVTAECAEGSSDTKTRDASVFLFFIL